MALAAVEAVAETRPSPKAVEAVIGALAAKFGNRLVTSQAVREQHGNTLTWIENQPPDAVVFPQIDRRRAGRVRICAQHSVPVDPVRHRHLARRPCQRAARRRLDRLPRHEPHSRGPRRGPRLRGRAGRHAQAAQRASARPGPVLPDRSRRRRLARRHGGDARLGHQRGALRHHEGQRAGAEGRAGERRDHHDRRAAPRNPRPATTSRGCSSARKARSASSPSSR